MRVRTVVLGLSAAVCLGFGTRAVPTNPPAARAAVAPATSQRVIVKLRGAAGAAPSSSARQQRQAVAEHERISELAARSGLTLVRARSILPGLHAVELASQTSGESLQASLARLRADPAVEYAEPDQRRYALSAPNDPLYLATTGATGQWYLLNPGASGAASALDAIDAWNSTTGSDGLVIADIDTGVRFDHPDLGRAGDGNGGRLLPGYSFVSNVLAANDGAATDADGSATWDADASDPGDWISSADVQIPEFKTCTAANSSWHGTRVIGILGAITNNNLGIAGLTWHGWILPVRALGKCGGADSDIETAMLWAAGVQVFDDNNNPVPPNPYPASVINLSLGATGACPSSYADVINQLNSLPLPVIVVAAAGNEGGPVDAPGNCAHVIAVAGLRDVGTKVGFSSLGPEIALGAPGGNCVNTSGPCLFSIDTTTNLGTTTPGPNTASDGYTTQTNINVGTSFATPQVAGIAALMLSVNANLTPAQIRARLQSSATAFPVSSDPTVPTCHVPANASDLQQSECNCTTQTCGAGMANANAAVAAALRPIAALAVPASVSAGQPVMLDASGSAAACTHTLGASSYQWSIIGGGNFSGPTNQSTATVTAPTSGSFTVQVIVTDDAGRTDSAQAVIGSSSATTTAPASAGNHACLVPFSPALAIAVTVSPSSAAVPSTAATQAFSAVVTGAANQNVSWQVNGIPGGDATTVGTISSAGVYRPPTKPPAARTVSVVAVSDADPTKTGFAGVTLPPVQVTVAPSVVKVLIGAKQPFAASVTNTSNAAVTWSVNGISGGNAKIGTISSSGIYTAPSQVPSPASVTVTAVSIADSTGTGSAQVTVSAPGGGGGSMDAPALFALAVLAATLIGVRRCRARPATQRRARRVLAGLTLTLLGAAGAAYGDSRWVAGVNYFVINPAQPTGLPAGKIAVTEIFSYACPGCNRFNPVAHRLQASLPANAVMDYLPASFRPDEDWPMFQRAYFAAKQLGIDQRTHAAMFDAVWKSGELAVFDPATQRAKRPAPTLADAARFYAQAAGVKPETFIATASSFAVDVSIRQADELIRNYGVAETPSIVVNGKYRLNPVSAGGYDQTIELVKWLVAQETRPGERK